MTEGKSGSNVKPDWKWLTTLIVMGLGWAYTLGIAREQLKENTKDIQRHSELLPYHAGVRILTDANAVRISALEIQQARIDEKLDRILTIVEKNHG